MHAPSSDLPRLRDVIDAAESGSLPALIEQLRHRGEDGALLARALRVDLATIVARPALTFPCVWARCLGLPALERLLHDFRDEHGARPWVEAMRPSRFPLAGALREEYRADLTGRGREFLGLETVGAGDVVWDRRTGARRPPFGEPHGRDDLSFDSGSRGWGRCRIVSRAGGAVVLDVQVNDDDAFTTFAATHDSRRVVGGGWFGDYEGTVCLFDATRGEPLWRTELRSSVTHVTISDDGHHVVAFSAAYAVVLDAATGAEMRRLFVEAPRGALGPTGRELVAWSPRALRVWALEAPDVRDPAWKAAGEGWVDAAFSPDGKRLLTGRLLCDARTGARLAELETDGPGYLEGGPPKNGRVLTNDCFIELSPMAGIAVWRSASGERAPPAAGMLRFGTGDQVCFSRDGRFIVVEDRRRACRLRVIRVDDGAELAGRAETDVTAFEMDPTRPQLVTGHGDGWIRIWALPDLTPMHAWRDVIDTSVRTVIHSLDGTSVATSGEDDRLRLWRLPDGAPLGERPRPVTSHVLHGWHGFVARRHPYARRWDDGFLVLEHDLPNHPPRVIPTDHDLEIDASGTRAAFRYEHFALPSSR